MKVKIVYASTLRLNTTKYWWSPSIFLICGGVRKLLVGMPLPYFFSYTFFLLLAGVGFSKKHRPRKRKAMQEALGGQNSKQLKT